MSYNPRPNPSGDTLVESRDQIRTNFQLIQTQFEKNHIDISNNGKHKFVQMPEQLSAPTTAADEGAIYTKEGSTSTVTELFFRREGNGTEIQLTGTGGVTPVILTGSVALTTSNKNIVAVPASSWGQILFSSQNHRERAQSGFFFCDATIAYAYANKIRQDASSSFDAYLVLNNLPAGLTIAGKTSSSSYNDTWDYKLIYWIV